MNEARVFRVTLPYASYLVEVCGGTVTDAPAVVGRVLGKSLIQLSDEVHVAGGTIVLMLSEKGMTHDPVM